MWQAFVALSIAVVGWGAKLQSDISVLEKGAEDNERLVDIQLAEINKKLDRIERKLFNGGSYAGFPPN